MALLGIARRVATRGARVISRNPRTTGAGAAGLTGGLLADDAVDAATPDLPGLEDGDGSSLPVVTIALVLGAVVALGQLFNINIGGGAE